MRSLFLCALVGVSGVATSQADPNVRPREGRYDLEAPLPALPSVVLDVDGDRVGIAQQTARAKNLQARILWIDATANLDRTNSAEKITALVQKIKSVGFNTIVMDVKPIVGYTIYPSKLTEKLPRWKGQTMPLSFDPLKAMAATCKREGIPLFVSMNAFSEGHRMAKQAEGPNNQFFKPGPGFEKPDQQTVLYEPIPTLASPYGQKFPLNETVNTLSKDGKTVSVFTQNPKTPPTGSYGVVVSAGGEILMDVEPGRWNIPGIPMGGAVYLGTGEAGQFLKELYRVTRRTKIEATPRFVPISERLEQQIPLMMNPNHPEVVKRSLAFIDEVARNYDINGVIFDDRLRYGNINADFSEVTRAKFDQFVGQKLNWPNDVFEFTFNADMTKGIKAGRFYDTWFAWRAQVIRDWVIQAEQTLHNARPEAQLGIYAGSWYGEYVRYGSNYASQQLFAGFSFLNDNYRKTGFAPHIDFLITGCYYPIATMDEALRRNLPAGRTVESAGQLSNRVVRDQTWAYAGISLDNFKNRPRALMDALQAATGSTQGVMVFDLSHDIQDFWDIFARAFKFPAKAPHMVPGLLAEVRTKRALRDQQGVQDPPLVIREGAAGTGL
ncbi:MAG: family 10 glycosylhydrolase [Armatimonadetes bacterium]|nr:family 10 glycosylhydrolase [Armatimonadota bacterium]